MASIQCPGCKAHISVSGLIDCPLCQTFLDPPFLRELDAAAARENRAALKAHRLYGPKEWFGMITVSAIAIMLAFLVYQVAVPSEGQLHSRKVSDALLACQQRIAGAAEFGNAETPPYSKNWAKGDEFMFAWPRGSFHFKNGFGASIPMSASCTGVVSSGEIRHLTVNGKEVF
jgi:hypothetical protein